MSNETLHIDELLSNSFAGFEPAMPALAWEGISAKLDAKSRKGGFAWWKAAAVALIVACAWYSLSHILNQNTNSKGSVETVSGQQKSNIPASSNSGSNATSGNNENVPESNTAAGVISNSTKSGNTGNEINNSHSVGTKPQGGGHEVPAKDYTPAPEPKVITPAPEQDVISLKQLVENQREGIHSEQIEDLNWKEFVAKQAELAKNFTLLTPPVRPLVSINDRWMLGVGVGQAVSNTGYSINNQFKDYVHPYFKREITAGEGLLSALNFNAAGYYKLGKESKFSVYSGVGYFQRKNSLNFDFARYTGFEDGSKPKDKFGNKAFTENWIPSGKPKDTINFKGTNTFSQIEIPLGIMYDMALGYRKNWSLIPSLSGNLGFITQKAGNTLDYHSLQVRSIDPTWYRTSYFSLNSSIGVYKNFGKNLKFGFTVNGSYMLTPMYVPGSSVRPRALTGGLSTQLIWRLTK